MLLNMIKKYLSHPVPTSVTVARSTSASTATSVSAPVADRIPAAVKVPVTTRNPTAVAAPIATRIPVIPARARTLTVAAGVCEDYAQQIAAMNDTMAITYSVYPRQAELSTVPAAVAATQAVVEPSAESVNASTDAPANSADADNVVSLPEAMDPDCER